MILYCLFVTLLGVLNLVVSGIVDAAVASVGNWPLNMVIRQLCLGTLAYRLDADG